MAINRDPGGLGYRVVLDRTAFYPTGGGQPHDTGLLSGVPVVDVSEDDEGIIYHAVTQVESLQEGSLATGKVDAARRLDHLQQHSGQHLLSQAFIRACGAKTRSFHLGPRTSTIDIELESPTEVVLQEAENIANAVVFEDRQLRVHYVDDEGALSLPLRKESAVRGLIRVIEIEEFDWSPCGGTHALRTGQIGLIAIRSWERAKGMTRVEFVCGRRALEDYRLAHSTAVRIARMFSSERDSSPDLVARALEENKELKKRARDLLELATTAEASTVLASATEVSGFKLVQQIFDNREPEELRVLASKIVAQEPAVAILATRSAEGARFVFARSRSLTPDMGKLVTEACSIVGGRGGGRPELAQGGGPQVQRLTEAMEVAATIVRTPQ